MHVQDICPETDMSGYSDVMFHREKPATAISPSHVTFAVPIVVINNSSVPASDAADRGDSFAHFLRQSSRQESESSVQTEIFRYNLYPTDGGTIFLRNVAKLLSAYVTSRPVRQ